MNGKLPCIIFFYIEWVYWTFWVMIQTYHWFYFQTNWRLMIFFQESLETNLTKFPWLIRCVCTCALRCLTGGSNGHGFCWVLSTPVRSWPTVLRWCPAELTLNFQFLYKWGAKRFIFHQLFQKLDHGNFILWFFNRCHPWLKISTNKNST